MTLHDSCLVYTPDDLADALVASIAPSRVGGDLRWLEPCVGKGALLSAMSRAGVRKRQIVGLDLAPRAEPTDRHATVQRRVDFLRWSARTTERFDRVVANPPYLAIEKLRGSLRTAAESTTVPLVNQKVPSGGNCWYAFLCAAISLLRKGGELAFVLPAAWEYANYARPLRERIASGFGRVVVCRSETPLFSGVQEGSIVLIAKDYQAKRNTALLRATYRRQKNLIRAVSRGGPARAAAPRMNAARAPRPVAFSDVATIRIGGVTGDSPYFLMNEEKRTALGLPTAAMAPVLSRAAHLTQAVVRGDDWRELRDAGERVWLFRPPTRMLTHPRVASYLRLHEDAGGCHRSNGRVRKRDPWHRTVLPLRPHGFLSGMAQSGPWVALSGASWLRATNTLYCIRFDGRLSREEIAAWCLMLLTDAVRDQVQSTMRCYADGLSKLEPGDLGSLTLPKPRGTNRAVGLYRHAVGLLLAGDIDGAGRVAKECL